MRPQDTFLDAEHVRESFPGHRVEIVNSSGGPEPVRPFRVTFPQPEPAQQGKKRKAGAEAEAGVTAEAAELPLVRVESYKPPDPGPYPEDEPKQNAVRFTPVQVEAIKAGAQPGLTMVVGPPGESSPNPPPPSSLPFQTRIRAALSLPLLWCRSSK